MARCEVMTYLISPKSVKKMWDVQVEIHALLCNQSIIKPQTQEFFYYKQIPSNMLIEVWILRTPDLWDGISVFHERQISLLTRFRIRGISPS